MVLMWHFYLELHQMDVKIIFLNGDLEEIIYMESPENFVLRIQKKKKKKFAN